MTVKDRDLYLHQMLWNIYTSNRDGDYSYYELFDDEIEEGGKMKRIPTDYFFYSRHQRDIFKRLENHTIRYEDECVTREILPAHYMAYLILDKISIRYRPRIRKYKDHSVNIEMISETTNNASFKRLKEDYEYFTYKVSNEIEKGATMEEALNKIF